MGNDGGSIPDRRDLVKSKPKVSLCELWDITALIVSSDEQAEQADKANQVKARWFFCALSKVCWKSSHPLFWLLMVMMYLIL